MTRAFVDICIDTDPYGSKPNPKVCSAQAKDLSGGQGGPVSVTRVEPKMLVSDGYVRPQFAITLQNSDVGSVIQYGQIATLCSSGAPARQDINTVDLAQIQFSQYSIGDFTCEPKITPNRTSKPCSLRFRRYFWTIVKIDSSTTGKLPQPAKSNSWSPLVKEAGSILQDIAPRY